MAATTTDNPEPTVHTTKDVEDKTEPSAPMRETAEEKEPNPHTTPNNNANEKQAQDTQEANLKENNNNTNIEDPDTDTGDGGDAQKRRRRRTQAELTRSFECPFRDCERKYASSHALTLHVRLKHPTEQHLYHTHLGQTRTSRPGFSSLFSSMGSTHGTQNSRDLGKYSDIRGVKHPNVDRFMDDLIALRPLKRMSLSSQGGVDGTLPPPISRSSSIPSHSYPTEPSNGQHELISRIIAHGGAPTGPLRSVSSYERSYGQWDSLPRHHAAPMRGGGRHSYPLHHASGVDMHPHLLHHSLPTNPYNDYAMGYSPSPYFPHSGGRGYNYEPDYYPNAYSMPMTSSCAGCALCPADPIDYYPYGFGPQEVYTPQHPFSKSQPMSSMFSEPRGAHWGEPSPVLEEEGLGAYRKESVCSEEEVLLARARGMARQAAVAYKSEVGKTLAPGHGIRERVSLDSAVF